MYKFEINRFSESVKQLIMLIRKDFNMKKILFQGDSITDAGRNEWDIGAGYPTLVAAELGCKYPGEYKIINRGVSGNRSVDMLARWRKDCIELKPDYLTIMIGVNDIWHEIDFQNGIAADKYEVFLSMMIEDVQHYLPKTKIILMEPYITHGTATDQHWEYFRKEMDKRIEAVNRLAEKYHLPCVHLQKAFNDALNDASAENWTVEGVHATPAGHMIIKNAWMEVFKGGNCKEN